MSSEDCEQNESLCETMEEKMKQEVHEELFPYVSEEVEIETSENANNKLKNEENNIRPLQPSDSYNGAIRDTYVWSQTITDIDVLVKLPKSSLKAKELKVNIEAQKIKVDARTVAIKGTMQGLDTRNENSKESEWTNIFEGELMFKTKKDESIWSLVPGYVSIHLEKASERWWDALITEEPKIELNKIDCSRNLYEMGSMEQMKIEELMWNHQQKLLGKPTSDQLKMEEIMKKAWNAEGSPFQGTPYDPSILKFN